MFSAGKVFSIVILVLFFGQVNSVCVLISIGSDVG